MSLASLFTPGVAFEIHTHVSISRPLQPRKTSITMASTLTDFKIASLAAGFTLGFGFLTVWTAIKQTLKAKSPLQSVFLWMLWGEIAANLGIGILGWLFMEGVIPVG